MTDTQAHTGPTKRSGRAMGRVHDIETGYLNAFRIALAIIILMGVLAVAAAILWYAFIQLAGLGRGAQTAADYIEAPAWESIRPLVLPTPRKKPEPDSALADEPATPTPSRQPVDERINRIAENLNAQFQRNSGNESGFTDRYPRRLLEAWVFEESGLPPSLLPGYLEALLTVSEAIGQDEQINRIGALDSRARVIMGALDAFHQEFLARAEQAADQAASTNAAAAASRSQAVASSIYLGLGGLGLLVLLALVVVLIRIEVHLRNQTFLRTLVQTRAEQDIGQRDH